MPRRASGINATMIRALKMTALMTAVVGECRRMTFSAPSAG